MAVVYVLMYFKCKICFTVYTGETKINDTYLLRSVNQHFERRIVIIFLQSSLNICFGCSKEPSHRGGSFEYTQHMFSLRIKKSSFQLRIFICRSV